MTPIQILAAEEDAAIRRCYPVLRLLRPHIADADELLRRVRRQAQASGYRLVYAEAAGEVAACAGFRVSEWLAWGRALYLDDLITREDLRGRGFAHALLDWLAETARREGCAELHLDSGTQRLAAHRVYHRHGFAISSFHFSRKLDPA